MVGVAELVDQPLRPLCFLHDALLVVLSERSREFVVVHGRAVLPLAPERGNSVGVDNLEDAPLPIQPVDAARVHVRGQEQLLHELPQVNAGGGTAGLGSRGGRRGAAGEVAAAGASRAGRLFLVII